MTVEAANEINETLHEHLKAFPQLRANLKFIGTIQEQRKFIVAEKVKAKLLSLGLPNTKGNRRVYESYYRRQLGKAAPQTLAHSTSLTNLGGDVASGIALNENWFNPGKREKLKQSLNLCVRSNFHPPGCNTVKSVIDHELGHQINDLLGLTTQRAVLDLDFRQFVQANLPDQAAMEAQVSKYARTNFRELLAEAWAEYRNSSAPRVVARWLGHHIESKRTP